MAEDKLKVVPVSKTGASQKGSLGSGSKTGNKPARTNPPKSIGESKS